MALLNKDNFIVFGTIPPEPEHLTQLPQGIPTGRVSAVVMLVPGETGRFYINAPAGLTVSDLLIRLCNDKGVVINGNIGSLTRVDITGLAAPQYIGNFTVPPGLKQDYYRFGINTGSVITSNRVWYYPFGDYANKSALFSFRNRRNTADIPYGEPVLSDFRQLFRLKCVASGSIPDTKLAEYDNQYNNQKRTTQIDTHEYHIFTSRQIDAIARNGFNTLLAHKDILVFGQVMKVKSGLVNANSVYSLSDATFELWNNFALQVDC